MSISLSHEIDYSSKAELHPNYRLDQLTQTNGTAVTLTAAGGNNSLFEINPVAFNLSKSYLCFDYTTPLLAASVSQQFKSCLPHIRQIQFYGRNGQMICDLQNFDIYTRIIFNSDISHEELTNSTSDTPIFRNNVINNDATITGANAARPGAQQRANLNYIEQAYVINGGAAAATTSRYRIPLSYFKNTIFALDKDLYFGDITYLRIYWNSYVNIAYTSNGVTNEANIAALAADVQLSNLYLYLAVETNEKINATLAQTISSNVGLNTLFDFVYQENFLQLVLSHLFM